MIFYSTWSKFSGGGKNTTKSVIILMLAFVQNLSFGCAAEDAGPGM
jgi:hypothetical protein